MLSKIIISDSTGIREKQQLLGEYQDCLHTFAYIFMTQQATITSENPYLQQGDWIQLQYQSLFLFSEGFKSAQVSMKVTNDCPLLSLFIIQHVNQSTKNNKKFISFNQPVVLIHRLSSKYLSFTPNFANKSEFKLRSAFSDHCQFFIRPLYKCQTIRGNLVKNEEQCMLSPALAEYATENINMVVGKFQKNTQSKVPIFLKKNEFSSLKIHRKNLQRSEIGHISNLQIYQLGHLQKKKRISCSKNATKNTYQATFISNHVEYDSLLRVELYYDNPQKQVEIKKGHYIAFSFLGSKRYLAFSEDGQLLFVEQKSQQAAFLIELYNNDKNLDGDSLLKVKHAKTEKYLSFNDNGFTLQQFRAFNIFQLNKLTPQDLKSTLFINQAYNGIQQYLEDAANIRTKRAFTSILKDIIKFIFKNKNIYEQFLSLQAIKYFITEQQQNLFASIGFITLLKSISVYCFGQHQMSQAQIQEKKSKSIENMSHQYNQQQNIYLQTCIIIVGICKNNRENIVKFSENLKIYYQHIGKIKGSIELFYHIYGFNTIGLEILQNQQFTLKQYQIKAIDLLFQFLYKRQFPLQTRTKLIKLFHSSIINDKNEKIHAHQQSMLTVFYENRFKNIMFTLSNNQDYQLIVSLKTERQELSNMIDNQDTYKLQLELLYEQLDLLTTLCSRASKKHVNLFRDMISEDMIKKYIKLRLNSQFKSLFLKILVNVYLNKDLSVSSQALIVLTNPKKKSKDQTAIFRKFSNLSELSHKMLSMNEDVEMQDVHQTKFKFMANINSLNEIKQLVKKNIKARLEKNQIKNQLIYCLYAINNFLEVQICNSQQGQQIIQLLVNYLRITYEDKKMFNNDLVQKFLGILGLNIQEKIKVKICNLFLKIREGYRQGEQKIKCSKKIVNLCNHFMQSQITNLVDPSLMQLLQNIINSSVQTGSYNIFQKSSKLYHKINKIKFYFLQMTKGIIPIQSDNSHDNLRKINKIYNSLTDYVIEYIYYHDNTVEISKLRKTITHLINQTVQLLQSHEDEEHINIMVQKMVGQFNFFDIIIHLIYQRQKDLQKMENNQLFQSIFKFIYLFFMNSDQNYFKNAKKIPKIKAIYQYQDRGQIKLLWNLTCMKTIANRLNNFIFDCWVTATRYLSQYSIYISLGFLKLLEPNQDQQNQINNKKSFINLILSENSILQQIFQGLSPLEQIFSSSYGSNARQQWLLNLVLVMKLLIFVYNQSKQSNLVLAACYRKYIPLKSLIKLIEQTFAIQFETDDDNKNIFILISLKLVKKYLLAMFNILYLSGHMIQFEYLLYIAQRVAFRLTIKNSELVSDEYIFKNLMFYNKHTQNQETMQLREVIMDYLKFQNPSHFEITPQDFHKYINNTYLFINVYYDFLFKVCQKMIEINLQRQDNTINLTSSVSTRQIDIFIQNIFKRYKQFIAEKLTYSEYATYVKAYSTSIKSTQQIVKKKVGLHFNYQANDEDGVFLLQGQQYFHNKQISYVFNSYLQSKVKVQRYLFESMLIMAYNPNLNMACSSQKSCFDDSMKAIVELIIEKMKNEEGSFRQKSQILYSYVEMNKKIPQWQPSLQYAQILKQVISASENMISSNLKYYIYCEKKLLQNYFSFKSNNFNRYKKLNFDSSEQFLMQFENFKNKIKSLIQLQIKYHDKKMLIDQSIVYFQSKKLNYQMIPRQLNIELILEWVLLKIKYNAENINRFYQLILEVIILLKAYTKFINEYDKKYISAQIYKKIQLCLNIIFRAITGNNLRIMMLLIQQQIWVQLNLLLSLNDTLQQNLEQLYLKTYDLIKLITRVKLDSLQNTYVQGVLQLYNNSISIYGQQGEILAVDQYPLIPIKSYFHQTKYIIAIIIKQFKHLPPNIATQFYSKLDSKYIEYNILNSFQKFNYLYGSYSIATVYPQLDYGGSKQQALAYSIAIQNGVQFTGIRMHMDMLNGRYQLTNIFNRHKIQINRHQKVQKLFDTLKNFFIDLLLLLVSIFYSNKKRREKSSLFHAVTFFLTKLSKVQIMFQDEIYVQDFMIYPQCKATRKMKSQLLGNLNFASNQLKWESIILAIQRFNLNYENQLRFFQKFIKIKLMLFMAKYLSVLKKISYLIVIINNIFLMVDQPDVSVDQIDVDFPFYILAFVNLTFSILILVIYCIKDLPLVLKIHKYELSQGLGYFGRKFSQKSQFRKKLILALMITTNLRLFYNLIYTIIVGLIFVNPIFASILLLDVLAHVPSLKTLLLSIWRPKYSLVLIMIAYVILQYFFSILLYFLFKNQASPYCDHLGQCFSFIFQTTFKAVHGFVGFLFLQSTKKGINKQITIFSLFQDIYVIFIYQIVIGLILAIVIDSFTVSRTQKLKQLDNLSHSCVVCNIQRSKFNIQSRLGFKGHVYINHSIFSYIDFKYGITTKPFDYLTDFELSVLGDKTSLWMPDGRTKQLEFQKSQLNPNIAKRLS